MLGTSKTTVRAMADRGELKYRKTRVRQRSKWWISKESVQARLNQYGRVREQGRVHSTDQPPSEADLRQLLDTVQRAHQEMTSDRDRLRDEVANLREVVLRLRARDAAITEADSYRARAEQATRDLAEARRMEAEALRRGLNEADEALGQFLIPGSPPPI
jgi:hypothetical protein